MGQELDAPLRLYLVGGAVLIDLGLRPVTMDIDYVARSEHAQALQQFERLLPRLKDRLNVSVEPASPADFMPVSEGVLDRSRYVRNHGSIAVYHYHYPTLALAKVARSAEHDLIDVELLIREGIITWEAVEQAWNEIRDREFGWLRQTPNQVQQRMQSMRQRLHRANLITDDPNR
jgi:hypothetical protein